MKIYPKRLLKAFCYTGASLFFIFHENGTNWLGSDVRWGELINRWGSKQSGFVGGLAEFVVMAFSVLALIYLIKGYYYFNTLHIEKNPVFENSIRDKFRKPCSGYDGDESNLEKFKTYRDSKMSTMMNSEAAQEYKKTAWVDSLTSDNGKSTQSVKRYINANLAAKTNTEGYNWLKK